MAELGTFPLLINVQKRASTFWKHLKLSDPDSYHYKALKCQEVNKKSLLCQLVLQLTQTNSTNKTQPHDYSITENSTQ